MLEQKQAKLFGKLAFKKKCVLHWSGAESAGKLFFGVGGGSAQAIYDESLQKYFRWKSFSGESMHFFWKKIYFCGKLRLWACFMHFGGGGMFECALPWWKMCNNSVCNQIYWHRRRRRIFWSFARGSFFGKPGSWIYGKGAEGSGPPPLNLKRGWRGGGEGTAKLRKKVSSAGG